MRFFGPGTNRSRSARPIVVAAVALLLYGSVQIARGGNIDAERTSARSAANASGCAWGATVGWVNFDPTGGGVSVYSGQLEGYAWAENIGWIRLGSYTGGGSNTASGAT
jgi:transglutaminase-like putative cysteine protease